jgi:IS6 family transposase
VPLCTRGSPASWPVGAAHRGAVREQPVETDHGRLKARLRPTRGLKRHRSARILAAGYAFVQNLRRGHYDITTDVPDRHRLRIAFDDLAITI